MKVTSQTRSPTWVMPTLVYAFRAAISSSFASNATNLDFAGSK